MYYACGKGCFVRENWPSSVFPYISYVDTLDTYLCQVETAIGLQGQKSPLVCPGNSPWFPPPIPNGRGRVSNYLNDKWGKNTQQPTKQLLLKKELLHLSQLELSLCHYRRRDSVSFVEWKPRRSSQMIAPAQLAAPRPL